jgi:hypothetical protein
MANIETVEQATQLSSFWCNLLILSSPFSGGGLGAITTSSPFSGGGHGTMIISSPFFRRRAPCDDHLLPLFRWRASCDDPLLPHFRRRALHNYWLSLCTSTHDKAMVCSLRSPYCTVTPCASSAPPETHAPRPCHAPRATCHHAMPAINPPVDLTIACCIHMPIVLIRLSHYW